MKLYKSICVKVNIEEKDCNMRKKEKVIPIKQKPNTESESKEEKDPLGLVCWNPYSESKLVKMDSVYQTVRGKEL